MREIEEFVDAALEEADEELTRLDRVAELLGVPVSDLLLTPIAEMLVDFGGARLPMEQRWRLLEHALLLVADELLMPSDEPATPDSLIPEGWAVGANHRLQEEEITWDAEGPEPATWPTLFPGKPSHFHGDSIFPCACDKSDV